MCCWFFKWLIFNITLAGFSTPAYVTIIRLAQPNGVLLMCLWPQPEKLCTNSYITANHELPRCSYSLIKQLSTSPHTHDTSLKTVSRHVAWITSLEWGRECQCSSSYECAWMDCVRVKWGYQIYTSHTRKNLLPFTSQIKLQSSRQHQTMQQQTERPGPHSHESWRLL